MKFVVFLFGFAVAASAIKQEPFQIPQEKLINVNKVSAECAAEFNVDPELTKKIPDGTLPRDEVSTKYLNCVTFKLGLTYEDGHMNVDKMASFVDDHPLKEALIVSLKKCNEVTKESPFATLIEMNRCVVEEAPIRFLL